MEMGASCFWLSARRSAAGRTLYPRPNTSVLTEVHHEREAARPLAVTGDMGLRGDMLLLASVRLVGTGEGMSLVPVHQVLRLAFESCKGEKAEARRFAIGRELENFFALLPL